MTESNRPIPDLVEISAWSADERAVVARSLAQVDALDAPPPPTRRRRMVLAITTISVIVLISWTFYLSIDLRDHHRVTMWNTAWIGFDVLLVCAFALSAWSVWKRRLVANVFLSATAVLLLVDMWFDITMSWGTHEQRSSLITAACVELPLFVILVISIRTALLRIDRTVGRLRGEEPSSRSVFGQPMPVPMDADQLRDEIKERA